LNLDHEIGGPKAQAFQRILGIELADVDYLAEALQAGVRRAPISDNALFGVLCEVRIPVAGLREHQDRVVAVTTAWELRHPTLLHGWLPPISTGNLRSMGPVKHAISEHDVVVLREPVGAGPAGATGAVISVYDDTLLVEITGPGGKTLDTIEVAAARLDVKHA